MGVKITTGALRGVVGLCLAMCLVAGCSVKYSFTGASIPPEAKTFSVALFPNMAPLVVPTLSPTFTDDLMMKMLTNTKLRQVDQDGDFAFEGEIIGYSVTPQAVTAGEIAARNRLTITVKVRFKNRVDDKLSFDKSFAQYEDYDSARNLSEVETELIHLVTEKIIEDIFNAAVTNW